MQLPKRKLREIQCAIVIGGLMIFMGIFCVMDGFRHFIYGALTRYMTNVENIILDMIMIVNNICILKRRGSCENSGVDICCHVWDYFGGSEALFWP